jgi:DNA ligase (NAD+)
MLGFKAPISESKVFDGIEAVISYCQDFESKRDNLPYEIDGMVIKVDSYELQEKLGMTTHHPRWAMAYKFKARQATSTLRDVEFQVGRTGAVTPVAKIDPVPIGGVMVSSISLFNEDIIREKDLFIGDRVLVERAGDVIPYIVKSLADVRDGSEKPIHFPNTCPACQHPLSKPDGESVWRCNNFACEAQIVERMIHFVSKDAMDIRSLGESNIRKFYQLKFIQTLTDIYKLDYVQLSQLDGLGAKSIQKLEEAIQQSKSQPLHRLIFGLGIRYVGETTAKTLAKAVLHLQDLRQWSYEALLSLEDIGPKVAGAIRAFFEDPTNVQLLEDLEALGVQMKGQKGSMEAGGSLSGKTFLFTGTLHQCKRSEAEALVESKGGKILSGVSSKLNYLVVGEDAGSKLEKAKKITSIFILQETEFLQLMNSL